MEVEYPEKIKAVMADSEAQAEWEQVMDPVLVDSADQWMDEVYRMV